MVRTLLVDNYDSFTYNLYALLTAVNGAEPTVIRNDSHWDALDFGRFDTSLSPRGREPRRRAMISALAPVSSPSRDRPLLGVCLGHQGLCSMWGARVQRAPEPVHGRPSTILHTGEDLFGGLPSPLVAVRYHSLVVTDLPAELEVTAWATDGLIMAVRHRSRPMRGLQFHPESIASEYGRELLTNFRDSTPLVAVRPRSRPRSPHMVATSRPRSRPVVEHIKVDHHPRPDQVYTQLFDRGQGGSWLDGGARRDRGSRFTIIGDAAGRMANASPTTSAHPSCACAGRACPPSICASRYSTICSASCTPAPSPIRRCRSISNPASSATWATNSRPRPAVDARTRRRIRMPRWCSPTGPSSSITTPGVVTHCAGAHRRTTRVAPAGFVRPPTGSRNSSRPPRRRHRNPSSRSRMRFDVRHRCHPTDVPRSHRRCLDLISAGETYEVCLTNTLTVDGDRRSGAHVSPYAQDQSRPVRVPLEFDDGRR